MSMLYALMDDEDTGFWILQRDMHWVWILHMDGYCLSFT